MRILPLCFIVACGSSTAPPPPAGPDPATLPDVVLVTLDTVRADRIGAWGYSAAHTETIDALAAAGRRYARAISPLPLTIPSHASMFTGLYPPRLGIRDNGHGVLTPDRLTLAEVLHDAGYVTAASTAAFVTTRQWGFDQGFDVYFDGVTVDPDDFWHAERPANAVIDDVLAWKATQPVGAAAPPRFVWAHLYDAHFPWVPPPEALERAGNRPYDGEITWLDDQVQRLVDAFTDRPVLFVIVADHGESLGDHGELNHGLFVYDATQHVPFLLSGPGIDPAVVTAPVSLVDLLPIVLTALGLPIPEGIDGRAAPEVDPRPLYMESHQLTDRYALAPHRAVVDGPLVLIHTPRPELYDVSVDPGQAVDLAASRPEDVARLVAALDAFGFEPPKNDAAIDPEVAAQLQQLGYVAGGFEGDRASLPDPKDHTRLLTDSQRAARHASLGEHGEAVRVLTGLVEAYPDVVELRARLVTALRAAGRGEEAARVAHDAYARFPDHGGLKGFVAHDLVRRGEFREASRLFAEIARDMPYAPSARAAAVQALLADPTGYADAVALGTGYLATHPDDRDVAGLLGVAFVEHGEEARGVPLLELGATADRPRRGVMLHLGLRARRAGDPATALRHVRRELELYPGNVGALKAAYRLYAEGAEWGPLVATLDKLIAREDTLEYRHAKAQALFNLEDFAACRVELDAALARWPESALLALLDANLLAKEGHRDAAEKRFAAAKALRTLEETPAATGAPVSSSSP